MAGRVWRRFFLLALFLLAVAVVVGLLGLERDEIIAVMLVAYLVTVGVEWAASRPRSAADGAESRATPAPAVAAAHAPAPAPAAT
ncbi:MAG TPA: hypothetical protein VNT58_08920, partial [Gaiellaceae bacterium]|nr:hypothetical protein [Gaiellaceae bacterium]